MNSTKTISSSFKILLLPSQIQKISLSTKSNSKISAINRAPMSIPTKIPNSPLLRPPLLHPTKPSFPSHRFVFSKNITIERISTGKSVLSAVPSASAAVSLQPLEELPPKLQEIVKLFQAVQEPKAKYEQLLFYGKNLTPLESKYKTDKNKVRGCVSQVWVRAYLDEEKNVVFEAESDSMLTKGLAALLVQGLSGSRVDEIVRVSPDFAVLLGLQQSLTPSRNNGFLNMLKLMQKKALQLYIEAEREETAGGEDSGDGGGGDGGGVVSEVVSDSKEESRHSGLLGSRGRRIKEILEKELGAVSVNVEDISYQHAGHAGVAGSDGETHFNVEAVSEEFGGKSLVKRHRMIYSLLKDELESGLHALSIVAKTPSEVDSQ